MTFPAASVATAFAPSISLALASPNRLLHEARSGVPAPSVAAASFVAPPSTVGTCPASRGGGFGVSSKLVVSSPHAATTPTPRMKARSERRRDRLERERIARRRCTFGAVGRASDEPHRIREKPGARSSRGCDERSGAGDHGSSLARIRSIAPTRIRSWRCRRVTSSWAQAWRWRPAPRASGRRPWRWYSSSLRRRRSRCRRW